MDSQIEARPWLRQNEWEVRFEWGPTGVEAVAAGAVVIVDVLRFTTAVDAGVGRGVAVFPYRWKDSSAQDFADQVGAVLADPGDPLGPSLSPVSLLPLGPQDRVVLPSPNGSTCAAIAHDKGAVVVAACLRNAHAVGDWLNQTTPAVTVIACGERWENRSLRPSLEDYLGAGAVISTLTGTRSPEAAAAADAWTAARTRIRDVLADCVSGREATARGWGRDLDFAAEVDVSAAVPLLRDGCFVDARAGR
jgi:2-phosphosulfolactate phosphatase